MYKTEGGGLGIRMESTEEVDEEGQPQSGSVHHVIQYIHPQVCHVMSVSGVLFQSLSRLQNSFALIHEI